MTGEARRAQETDGFFLIENVFITEVVDAPGLGMIMPSVVSAFSGGNTGMINAELWRSRS